MSAAWVFLHVSGVVSALWSKRATGVSRHRILRPAVSATGCERDRHHAHYSGEAAALTPVALSSAAAQDLSGGFRRLDVDYRSGGTRLNVTMAGPLLGVTWRC